MSIVRIGLVGQFKIGKLSVISQTKLFYLSYFSISIHQNTRHQKVCKSKLAKNFPLPYFPPIWCNDTYILRSYVHM